jgi:glycosyltransferase
MEMAGPLLSGLLSVPAVKYPLGLPMRDNVVTGLRRGGAALRVRYGMPDRPGEPAMVLDVCPSGLRSGPEPRTLNRQPMRYLPYNGSGAIAEWSWEPRVGRRVCVTNSVDPGDVIDVEPLLAFAAAVADDETDVVVPLPAHRLEGAQAPDGVRLVEWMPLHIAARGCAAVVHSGDPLSTFTFLSGGVPQLIRPTMSDEVRHGTAVEQAGAGRSVRADQPLEQSVQALRELLADNDCRKRAEALADEIRSMPSPADVATKVEALAGGERR